MHKRGFFIRAKRSSTNTVVNVPCGVFSVTGESDANDLCMELSTIWDKEFPLPEWSLIFYSVPESSYQEVLTNIEST